MWPRLVISSKNSLSTIQTNVPLALKLVSLYLSSGSALYPTLLTLLSGILSLLISLDYVIVFLTETLDERHLPSVVVRVDRSGNRANFIPHYSKVQ